MEDQEQNNTSLQGEDLLGLSYEDGIVMQQLIVRLFEKGLIHPQEGFPVGAVWIKLNDSLISTKNAYEIKNGGKTDETPG